jgi:hypothetical protein
MSLARRNVMRIIGRLIALLWGGLLLALILGMFAALAAKRRIVPEETAEADEVRLAAIFGPINFRSTASSFRGGTLDCWYGGGVVDLRDADLDAAGAHLQVRAVFGGGQIVVPETWQVSARVVGIGGLGDARPRIERAPDAPLLTVDGLAMFGGFAVVSEIPEGEARQLSEAVARRAGQEHQEPPISPIPEHHEPTISPTPEHQEPTISPTPEPATT